MTRVGLVVGGSGGIGAACALALVSSVDHLVLVGRDAERLHAVASKAGPGVQVVRADLAQRAGRAAILTALRDAAGELHWVVIASGRPLRGPLAELDEEMIEDTFQTNLVGPTLLLRALAEVPWAPSASLVVIGSISATRALAARTVYAASKAGLERLALSLAAEWAPRGIRVSVIAPGVIDTPFLGEARSHLDAWAAEHVPLGRTGSSEEIAEVVRYVCLESPAYLVGARIAVDGGSETIA